MTTRDRPRFLDTALRCYRHQRYANRELVVVDDGARFPADRASIEAAGGRLIRAEPGTPLGTKLNLGVRHTRGTLCQKIDDDDWYGPRFLETMVATVLHSRTVVCRPVVAFVAPFILFELATWELRVTPPRDIPGATLLFSREDWEARPFRALRSHEDIWFLMDQRRRGVSLLPVSAPEQFLAIRHRRQAGDRGHTWTRHLDGRTLETVIAQLPEHTRPPEALLPRWAVSFYRRLHREAARPAPAAG